MSHSFHYLIMAEQSMFQKELLARLKDTGLTIGQPKILDYLKDHDGAGQKDIARGCHIEPGTLPTSCPHYARPGTGCHRFSSEYFLTILFLASIILLFEF